MSQIDQYKMYSITEAAREMHLGKDTLYLIINQGLIGTIKIGKREKIPASEITRFQSENIKRQIIAHQVKEIHIPQTTKLKSKSLFRALKQEILNGECI